MNRAMRIVGYADRWTQPISARVMMQDTGIQTPVGIKVKGKDPIRNDNGELAAYVYVNVSGVTASEYVERARAFLRDKLMVPSGYALEWTGVYQYAQEARRKLRIVVPITLAIMFGLLVMAFRSVTELAHHAVGAVCAGWRRDPAGRAGLLDHHGGHHRLRVAGRWPERFGHHRPQLTTGEFPV
jgi:Cu/Ag efflux pump CusA